MPKLPCQHLEISDEAYCIDAVTGATTPAIVHMCGWTENNPAGFVNSPRWLVKRVFGFLAITPEHDCKDCPGYLSPSPPSTKDERQMGERT